MVISVINEDSEVYRKFKSYCVELGLPVTKVLWKFIEQTVSKYDQGKKLDAYFDPDFISVPKISDSYDDKLKWLKTQTNEKIEPLRDEFYRLHIMSKALLDTADKRNFNLDYVAAWNRYR